MSIFGRWALAHKIAALEAEIEREPAGAEEHIHLAQLYRQQGQPGRAEAVLRSVLHREPDRADRCQALLGLADICLERGDVEQATKSWAQAAGLLEGRRTEAQFHQIRGRIDLERYQAMEAGGEAATALEEAVQALRYAAALAQEPEMVGSIYYRLALAHRAGGRPQVAAKYLKRALGLEAPRGPETRHLAAECLLELGRIELWDRGQPEQAGQLFTLALKTSPLGQRSNWRSHVHWCASCARALAGDVREAIREAERCQRCLDPEGHDYAEALFDAHERLGATYADKRGQAAQAIYHYQQALAVRREPEIYRLLGEVYSEQGQFGQALAMFEAVLAQDPDYAHPGDVYQAMGVCLGELGRYDEALACFEKAREEQATITFRPHEIYSNEGITYWRLGRLHEAAAAFKTALALMHPRDGERRRIEPYLRAVQGQMAL